MLRRRQRKAFLPGCNTGSMVSWIRLRRYPGQDIYVLVSISISSHPTDIPRHAIDLWNLIGIKNTIRDAAICNANVECEHKLWMNAVVRSSDRHGSCMATVCLADRRLSAEYAPCCAIAVSLCPGRLAKTQLVMCISWLQ